MKKIIGLYGRQNSGKTTTLNLLIELLEREGQEDNPVTIDDYRGKTIGTTPGGDDEDVIKGQEDNPVTIDDYRGKTIVITPGGDDKEVIKNNLEAFGKAEGDILVTATRTKGQTASYLSNYFPKNSVKITWIKKNYAELLTDLVNQAQAEDIKAVIDKIIKGWEK